MEQMTFGPSDLPLGSVAYGTDEAREKLRADCKAKETVDLHKEIHDKHERSRSYLRKAKPDGESGYRMSALMGDELGLGKTEAEVVESIQRLNDEIGMARATLRERDFARQVFGQVEEREAEGQMREQMLRDNTGDGQVLASIAGQAPTFTGLLAAGVKGFSATLNGILNGEGKLSGTELGYKSNHLTAMDLVRTRGRAQNAFTKADTNEGWAPQVIRDTRMPTLATVRPPQLIEVLPTVPMQNGGYKFMRESAVTNAVATRAEAAEYPEQALEVKEITVTAEKVAVFLHMSEEQIEDVMGATSYIDSRLPYLLGSEVDNQVYNGNGTSPNFTGFANTTGINDDAKLSTDILLDHYADSIASIGENSKRQADFITMNTKELVRLQTQHVSTTDNRYLLGDPGMMRTMMVWGIPVVICDAIANNAAMVGVSMDCAIGEQRGVRLEYGYIDKDFTKGMKTVRCDCRGNLVVYDLDSFRTLSALNL